MIKLKKIYFDGQSYAKSLVNKESNQAEINIANRFNFAPVDSISFESYQPQTFCDITIGDYYLKAVSLEHLYTNIQRKASTILYPGHNPTANPGGLY
jgi:uncharacterized protein (UPF0333 family)